VIPLLPTAIDTFDDKLRAIADEYSRKWPKIGSTGPDWVFFECYCGEDQEDHSGQDGGNAEHIIMGTLSTLDFVSGRGTSAPSRQEEELDIFVLRIERIPYELWVGDHPLEEDDIELLFERTYSAKSV
jgi:hypothetical protein